MGRIMLSRSAEDMIYELKGARDRREVEILPDGEYVRIRKRIGRETHSANYA